MSPKNLATVFAPNLLRRPEAETDPLKSLQESGYASGLVQILIEEFQTIFGVSLPPVFFFLFLWCD